MLEQVRTQATLATCPDCGQRIRLTGGIFVGRTVTCPNCTRQLAVVETAPPRLGWAYEEWDIDEDDW